MLIIPAQSVLYFLKDTHVLVTLAATGSRQLRTDHCSEVAVIKTLVIEIVPYRIMC